VEKMTEGPRSHPFNSALETGVRALVVLEALHPRQCDLTELTWFDHLVVHTGDIQGEDVPASLHPDLPNRTGELLVRRRLVEESLLLMQRVHLVDVVDGGDGISFAASEDAPSFLDLLKAPYTVELKKRAAWVAKRFSGMSKTSIGALVDEKIGRWTAEFQVTHPSTS
jgi:hypothetical protein